MSNAKSISGPSQLQLVNSSRLQALRNQSAPAKTQPHTQPVNNAAAADSETARCRQLVEQKLAQILATLPTGKQRSLFKIRFGVEPEALHAMSPQQAAKALKIKI